MNLAQYPKMIWSYGDGWKELMRVHPTPAHLMWRYAAPMSLLPPAMFAYAAMVHPGTVLPDLVPAVTGMEVLATCIVFFLAQLLMVRIMAAVIQKTAEMVDAQSDYLNAFTLATVAPTPLWLASLSLFVPSFGFMLTIGAIAWCLSAALVLHGVEPLFRLENHSRSRLMAGFILSAGVMAWIGMIVVMAMLMSILLQWR